MLKAVILSSETNPQPIVELLEEGLLFDIEVASDPDALLSDPDTALDYDLFIVSGAPPALSLDAHKNFDHSIATGGGLLILGGVAHPDAAWPLFDRLAVWLGSGKPSAPVRQTVKFLDHQHPVTRGIRDFEIEAPFSAVSEAPHSGVYRLLASASPAGRVGARPQAALVSTSLGRGRVFHSLLAPDPNCDPLQRTLARAAEWVATGNVLDF